MIDRVRLQFSAQHDFGSALIRWFGHSAPYSHVDFVLCDGRLLGARSDAPVSGHTGVQIRAPDYAHFAARLVIDLPTAQAREIYAAAHSQIGKPYDHTAILAFFVDRNWRSPDSWFCSELVAWAFAEGGYWPHPWALPCPVNKVAPADLLLLLGPNLVVVSCDARR